MPTRGYIGITLPFCVERIILHGTDTLREGLHQIATEGIFGEDTRQSWNELEAAEEAACGLELIRGRQEQYVALPVPMELLPTNKDPRRRT